MSRFFSPFLFAGLIFLSSCASQPKTDLGTDSAMGLGAQNDEASAAQQLDQLQTSQIEERQRQLARQIAETAAPSNR